MSLNEKLLRLALLLSGLLLVVIGLNLALGGMHSMGWHMSPDFMTITDATLYHRHDSNVRLLGGVFLAFAIVTTLGAVWPRQLRQVIVAFLIAIAVGSVFRLIAPDFNLIADGFLVPSLLAEVVLCPPLAYWLWRLK